MGAAPPAVSPWAPTALDALTIDVLGFPPPARVLLCWGARADAFFLPLRVRLAKLGCAVASQRWTTRAWNRVAASAPPEDLARLWAPEATGDGEHWRIFDNRIIRADAIFTMLPPLAPPGGPPAAPASHEVPSTSFEVPSGGGGHLAGGPWHAVERAGFAHLDRAGAARARLLLVDWPSGARLVGTRTLDLPWLEAATWRALALDYRALRCTNARIAAALAGAHTLRVTCPAGTDLAMSMAGRPVFTENMRLGSGTEPISLPGGEVYVAVREDSGQGRAVIDVGGVPAVLAIESGACTSVAGPAACHPSLAAWARLGERLGELGLGTNPHAPALSVGTWVEKAAGTIHLGFGTNQRFGGTLGGDSHVDWMILHPTLTVDGAVLVRNGVCFPAEPKESPCASSDI